MKPCWELSFNSALSASMRRTRDASHLLRPQPRHDSRGILTAMTFLLVAFASPAYGYCQAPRFFPRAPSAPSLYERPDLPDCLSKHPSAGQVTCEPSETAAYAAEVVRYAAKLRRYADEVSRFATEATTFVENAESYLACEAADIGVQPDQLEVN